MHLLEVPILILLDKYPEMWFLDTIIILFLIFKETSYFFFEVLQTQGAPLVAARLMFFTPTVVARMPASGATTELGRGEQDLKQVKTPQS